MTAGHEGAGSQTVALAGRMVEYCKINHTFLFSHRSNLSHKKKNSCYLCQRGCFEIIVWLKVGPGCYTVKLSTGKYKIYGKENDYEIQN